MSMMQTPAPRGPGFASVFSSSTGGSGGGGGGGGGGGDGGGGSGAKGLSSASLPGAGDYFSLASFPPKGIGNVMAVVVDGSFPRRSAKGDTFCKVDYVFMEHPCIRQDADM